MIPDATPVARPSDAEVIGRAASSQPMNGRTNPPFFLYGHPSVFEVFDLTNAPPDALRAAGIDAGVYALCIPQAVAVVPGVNGITGNAEWKTTPELIDYGAAAVRAELVERGRVVLDYAAPIPREFLPPNIAEGGYLRRTRVFDPRRGEGFYFHTPWERLVDQGDDPARIEHDRARYGCWCAWLTRTGRLPVPSEQRLAAYVERYRGHVTRVQVDPAFAGEVREQRIEAAGKVAKTMAAAQPVSRAA